MAQWVNVSLLRPTVNRCRRKHGTPTVQIALVGGFVLHVHYKWRSPWHLIWISWYLKGFSYLIQNVWPKGITLTKTTTTTTTKRQHTTKKGKWTNRQWRQFVAGARCSGCPPSRFPIRYMLQCNSSHAHTANCSFSPWNMKHYERAFLHGMLNGFLFCQAPYGFPNTFFS